MEVLLKSRIHLRFWKHYGDRHMIKYQYDAHKNTDDPQICRDKGKVKRKLLKFKRGQSVDTKKNDSWFKEKKESKGKIRKFKEDKINS